MTKKFISQIFKTVVFLTVAFISVAQCLPENYRLNILEKAKNDLRNEIKDLNLIIHSLGQRIKKLEEKHELGGLILSAEDQRKLEFLLKQVISYK